MHPKDNISFDPVLGAFQTSKELHTKSSSDGHPEEVLTIAEVAGILRCSKSHVANLINGKVPGAPVLPHVSMGRRKVVRRPWLMAWLEDFKRQC